MVIYRTVCLINGKSYIGQTSKSIRTRISDHEKRARGKPLMLIQRAIKKYGRDNFVWGVVCECSSIEELNEKEIFYINHFNTINPNGYNIASGGVRGNTFLGFSEEKKKELSNKYSELFKGRIFIKNERTDEYMSVKPEKLDHYLNLGWKKGKRPLSDFTKQKLREINTGKRYSDETKNKHRESYNRIKHLVVSPHTHEDRVRLGKQTLGRIWIKNIELNKDKTIKPSELLKYSEKGWTRGRLDCLSENVKIGISNKLKGKIWIRNNFLSKSIPVFDYEVSQYLQQGWEIGKMPYKNTLIGTVYMVKDGIMKKVKKELMYDFLKEGWSFQRKENYKLLLKSA